MDAILPLYTVLINMTSPGVYSYWLSWFTYRTRVLGRRQYSTRAISPVPTNNNRTAHVESRKESTGIRISFLQ